MQTFKGFAVAAPSLGSQDSVVSPAPFERRTPGRRNFLSGSYREMPSALPVSVVGRHPDRPGSI